MSLTRIIDAVPKLFHGTIAASGIVMLTSGCHANPNTSNIYPYIASPNIELTQRHSEQLKKSYALIILGAGALVGGVAGLIQEYSASKND